MSAALEPELVHFLCYVRDEAACHADYDGVVSSTRWADVNCVQCLDQQDLHLRDERRARFRGWRRSGTRPVAVWTGLTFGAGGLAALFVLVVVPGAAAAWIVSLVMACLAFGAGMVIGGTDWL